MTQRPGRFRTGQAGQASKAQYFLSSVFSRQNSRLSNDRALGPGAISREDFIHFAKETHLLDFECSAMGEAILLLSPRKSRKALQSSKKTAVKTKPSAPETSASGGRDQTCSMLACFCSDGKVEELMEEKKMDKVEFAFRKFDSDEDGFLSWEEFQQVWRALKSLTI